MNEKIKLASPEEFREKDDTSVTDSAVFHSEVTTKLDLLVKVDKFNRQVRASKTEEPEAHGDTSAIRVYSFVQKRLGLKKLVSDWFRNK